jgi:hypothetical protein
MIISYFSQKKEIKNHGHDFLFSQSRKELIILYKIYFYLFTYLGGKKEKGKSIY